MRKNNNMDSIEFALLMVSFTPLIYFLLGVNWNPAWIIVITILSVIINNIIMEKN